MLCYTILYYTLLYSSLLYSTIIQAIDPDNTERKVPDNHVALQSALRHDAWEPTSVWPAPRTEKAWNTRRRRRKLGSEPCDFAILKWCWFFLVAASFIICDFRRILAKIISNTILYFRFADLFRFFIIDDFLFAEMVLHPSSSVLREGRVAVTANFQTKNL